MADRDEAERQERLIAALEAQANAVNRLVQVLEGKAERKGAKIRARPAPSRTKPIEVTPLVAASVERALARVRG